MSKTLIAIGALLIVAGLAWPLLQRLGLGRLPGDIVVQRENFVFYFPITTMLLISTVLTLVFWLLRR